MHHLYKGLLCTLNLLLISIPSPAYDPQEHLTIQLDELTEITNSTTPYLFTGTELSPLQETITKIAPLAQTDDSTTALKTLQSRLKKGYKTAPKNLVINALTEIETILNTRHYLIEDDEIIRTLAAQLDECKDLIIHNALKIDRAPRPPLQPGGTTGSMGSPNPAPESISGSSNSTDVNVIHNLYVGNDATIANSLSIGNSTTIAGPLTVTNASTFIEGGLHVGGPSDPGPDNLLVDGTSTLTGSAITNSEIDVTSASTLNIGTSNADLIMLGSASSTTTLNGTTSFTEKLITLNKGSAAGSADLSGFQLEENSSITGYIYTSPDRASWVLKPPSTSVGTITLTSGATGITIDQGLTLADSPTFANVTLTNYGPINFQNLASTYQASLHAPSLSASYTLTFPPNAGTAGQILSTDGSGVLNFINVASPVDGFVNGGNSFIGAATLGTLDNKSLDIKTESTTRITIANTAGLGVVTIIPNLILNANLDLNPSTIIYKDGKIFLHGLSSNLFLGPDAGASAPWGYDTALGDSALKTCTSGLNNTAVGFNALTAVTSGNELTAVGSHALNACTTGSANTAVGFNALSTVTTTSNNTALGHNALASSTGPDNTALGKSALSHASFTGNSNTALGSSAGITLTSGSNNILIGKDAGSAYTTENNNICIGLAGVATDSGVTRIAYIAGTTIFDPAKAVGVDPNNQLGTEFIAPVNATALTINEDATFNNLIRTQYHRTSYIYPTSLTGPIPNYLGFFYTNGDALNFGVTDLDRVNFSFNYRDTTPTGGPSSYLIPNPALGTAQITLGHTSTNGAAIVIGTNIPGIPPISRFEILEDGTINLSSSNTIQSANAPYIRQDGTGSFYAGPYAGNIGNANGTTAIGYEALGAADITNSYNNTAVGYQAGSNLTDQFCFSNVLIGATAGSALGFGSNNNIEIGSGCLGVSDEDGKVRIGNATNNSCILFSDSSRAINMAGSKWNPGLTNPGATRISYVKILPDGIGGYTWSGTSDILSVNRMALRPAGGWFITFVPCSANAFATATVIKAEPFVFPDGNSWTEVGTVTTSSVDVYSFNYLAALTDMPMSIIIMGIN